MVTGGARLAGKVEVAGAKNSVLKLMAAALLAEGTTTITNCPEILDVPLMADVLRGLGCGSPGARRRGDHMPAELGVRRGLPRRCRSCGRRSACSAR